MIGRGLMASAAIAALMLGGGPSAFAAGDVKEGYRIADLWCTSCHLVEDPQSRTTDAAPPFMQIANDPTKTDQSLRAWLADPHPPMPSLDLSRLEIENLMAYIRSLATTKE